MATFDAAITFDEDYYDFDGNLVGLPDGSVGWGFTGFIEVEFEGPEIEVWFETPEIETEFV